MFPLAENHGDEWLMYVSVAAGVLGILLAYLFYVASPKLADSFVNMFHGFYKLIYNKYFVDEFYDATVVRLVAMDRARRSGAAPSIGYRWRGTASENARATSVTPQLAQSGYIRSHAAWEGGGSIPADRRDGTREARLTLLDCPFLRRVLFSSSCRRRTPSNVIRWGAVRSPYSWLRSG